MRKNLYITLPVLLFIAGFATTLHLQAQQQQSKQQKSKPGCPMMRDGDMAEMNERGEKGMGFSQEKTTHHFLLTSTGGIIQVEANDPKDTPSRDQIRGHLRHIAMMFAEGNFDIPMFVHGQTPAGVEQMKSLKASISYRYEETERGGRVRIASDDAEAIAAIQSFLRFQITEHKTGDKLEVDPSL